ncbi:hypothetical protein ACWKSP_39275 [Micromonosporaceae bacterium Da 78-11]
MRRSAYRRAAATSSGRNRRLLAVGAVLTALGGVVAFTTISNAATTPGAPAGSGAGKVVNGQTILTDTCVDSKLPPHDGFQLGGRCVSTEFGEVGEAASNPSLLITEAPRSVAANTPFTLKVSTRNLIRDRFLAAGKGGYYVESSVLKNGLVRGHFHTACRMLASTDEAPAAEPVPAFFVATEDGKGDATPDEVTIQVPGLPTAGQAQCASWAGDGSHRIPMMQRANQTPALDAVRITVNGAQQGGGNNNGGNTGGNGNNGGATTPTQGATTPAQGSTQPPATKPATTKPATTQPATTQPATTQPTPAKPAPSSTQPTTKDDFTPDPTRTVSPETTRKAESTRTATAKPTTQAPTAQAPAEENGTEGGTETGTESGTDENGTDEAAVPAATTKAPKPKSSSKSAAATDYTYSNDDGQLNSGTKPPTVQQQAAEPPTGESSGPLALTGTNTVAFVGGGAVLVLIGLIVMAFSRRRRPGSTWQ